MNIGSAEYTEMSTIDSTLTPATTFEWSVDEIDTDAATGQKEYSWQNTGWKKYLGYYYNNSQTAASIDRKAVWTVGQGFDFKGNVVKRFLANRKLGLGKDTLTGIFYNLDRTAQIGGDVLAEIIKDKSGRLVNLKPINPGRLKIIVNEKGRVIRYELISNLPLGRTVKFKPEEIFHIPFNRVADEVHGISEFIRIENTIKMREEARLDLKKLFHRYIKPSIISTIDSDDTSKISDFKTKLDKSVELGENLVIPKGVVELEKMSVPQHSTLDPLPWIDHLTKELVASQGTPLIVLGIGSKEDTEASSKIIYLGFEQYIKFRQMIWEENIKSQLGLDIKFKFPASIAPSLLEDNKKDGQLNKKPNVNPAKHE